MMKKETWKTVIQIIVQYIDGNRDLAGSNQLHEVKEKKVRAISAFLYVK